MGLTSFIGMRIGFVVIVMIALIFKLNKRNSNNKPRLLSLLALGLIILNWILYLSGFYAMIPEGIGDLIFLPVWFIVSIIGFIAAYRELRNNRIFIVVNGGLAIISFITGMLAWAIGNL